MKSLFTSVATSFAARMASKAEHAPTSSAAHSVLGRVRHAAFGALLFASTVFATPVVAQQQQQMVVDKPDAVTFRVRTQNLAKQPVQVEVISLVTGQKLFAERYKGSYYTRCLSFQGLEAGSYLLITKLGQDSYRYTIQIKPAGTTGQTVAVRTVRVRLGKQSQQVAALNTPIMVVAAALATSEASR